MKGGIALLLITAGMLTAYSGIILAAELGRIWPGLLLVLGICVSLVGMDIDNEN
jgi:hypothetical protein